MEQLDTFLRHLGLYILRLFIAHMETFKYLWPL